MTFSQGRVTDLEHVKIASHQVKLGLLRLGLRPDGDFLLTYLVNPWTARYVGYNGNAQNIALLPTAAASEIVRTRHFLNDAKQFFIRASYLLRF